MPGTIVIIGASARAAAFSALRAGWRPWCADLFADADLARRCEATAISPYPDGLLEAVERAPPGPWMYTGALENAARLVERLAARRPLCGNAAPVLTAIRNPQAVAEALGASGLCAAQCVASTKGLPQDGTWLRKPLRSAGGRGIAPWDEVAAAERCSEPVYFQKRVEGTACAAAYVAAGSRSRLLGVTEQLLGHNPRGPGFAYRGSIGPLRVPRDLWREFARIGQVLAASFELRGVFGVDAIVQGRQVAVVEVNPRYTASMEILERAGGPSIVGMHLAACLADRLPPVASGTDGAAHGKWIVFADRSLAVGDDLTREMLRMTAGGVLPAVADIPRAGTKIEAREPIVTVFARGRSREEVLWSLKRRAMEVRHKPQKCVTSEPN
jgi:predicted ATP-grasp superfamily ATP-dependent carboligase